MVLLAVHCEPSQTSRTIADHCNYYGPSRVADAPPKPPALPSQRIWIFPKVPVILSPI